MSYPVRCNNQPYTLTDDEYRTLLTQVASLLGLPADQPLAADNLATCFQDTWELTRTGDWWHITVYDPDYRTVETAHYAAQTVTLVYALAVCGERGCECAGVGKL